ncbi:hypothetical protein HDU91_005195 [Kappamyces sp. JEL0680]|nr:hypothetical protein HDU91_005195 [Kappamyces sp. JEL0680]
MQPETLKPLAQVILGYLGSYTWTILLQLVSTAQLTQAYKPFSFKKWKKDQEKKGLKERYNRYTDPFMIPVDRSVGNFIEWQIPFLSTLVLNAALNGPRDIWVGWIYVAIKFLYPVFALMGGLDHGKVVVTRPLIFLSTVPGYGVLMYYSWKILGAVLA